MKDKLYPRIYERRPTIIDEKTGEVLELSDWNGMDDYYVENDCGRYRIRTVNTSYDIIFEDEEGVKRLARRVSTSYLAGVGRFCITVLAIVACLGLVFLFSASATIAQYDKVYKNLTSAESSSQQE